MNIFTKRFWKFLWQRWTRGFDDSETWSLDSTISYFILPRLKRFKEIYNNGNKGAVWLPGCIHNKFKEGYELNQYGDIKDKKIRKIQWKKAAKYYDDIIQSMVDLFQDIYDEEYNNEEWYKKWEILAKKESKKQKTDISAYSLTRKFREEQMKIFSEYYFSLWW